jgi:ATP/maltotriose-dependent transcriptional regulator MalT
MADTISATNGITVGCADLQEIFQRDRAICMLAPIGFRKTESLRGLVQTLTYPVAWLQLLEEHEQPAVLLRALTEALSGLLAPTRRPPSVVSAIAIELGSRKSEFGLVIDDIDRIGGSAAALALLRRVLSSLPGNVGVALAASRRFREVRLAVPEGYSYVGSDVLELSLPRVEEMLERASKEAQVFAPGLLDLTHGWPKAVYNAVALISDELVGWRDMRPVLEERMWPSIERMIGAVSRETRTAAVTAAMCPWMDDGMLVNVLRIEAAGSLREEIGNELPIVRTEGDRLVSSSLVGSTVARHGGESAAALCAVAREYYKSVGDAPALAEVTLRVDGNRAQHVVVWDAIEDCLRRREWHSVIAVLEHWRQCGRELDTSMRLALAEAYLHCGNNGLTETYASEALAESLVPADRARALLIRSIALQLCGRSSEALDESAQLAVWTPYLSPAQRINALRNVAACHARGLDTVAASRELRDAFEIASLEGDAGESALIAVDLSAVELLCGRFDIALRHGRDAIELSDLGGVSADRAIARNNSAAASVMLGRREAARRWLRDAQKLSTHHGQPRIRGLIYGTLVELNLEEGDLEGARRHVESACRLASVAREYDLEVYCLGLAVEAALEVGDVESARRYALTAGDAYANASSLGRVAYRVSEARLLLAVGDTRSAERLCDDVLDEVGDTALIIDQARAYLVRAQVQFVRAGLAACLTDLTEACRLVRITGRNSWLARHIRGMEACLRAVFMDGHREVYACLLSPGVLTPSRKSYTMERRTDPIPDALSERERQIVLLLCEGLQRGDIARRVGLSRSTVDKVISNIYAATGFRACYQVVAWAHRTGLFRDHGAS